MNFFQLLCLVGVMGLCSAYPSRYRLYPRSYMLGGSVYSNPRYVREGYDYAAPGQMTAMVIGDTVATNSYSGTPYSHPSPVVPVSVESQHEIQDEQVSEQVTEKQQPLLIAVQEPESINETEPDNENPLQNEQETLFTLEEGTTEVPVVTTTTKVPAKAPGRKIKTGKGRKPTTTTAAPVANEEEDEEEESGVPANWPFGNTGRGGIPSYNAFFPIFIGGSSPSGRSRTRSAEDAGGYPGSATAIANSFSTGKGGVATSHATSFGDPYAATMLRNAGLFNFRTKAVKKHAILEDE